MSRAAYLWITALSVAMAVLVTPLIPARAASESARVRVDRFDAPDAAERQARARRMPRSSGIDTVALYAAAEAQVRRMTRFSSRIGRQLPASQPAARLWLSGAQTISLTDGPASHAILDAWTPLGPGNIGGRTRVVRYHPTNHDRLFAGGVSGGLWRSDDAGGSWRPLGDGLVNIAVNSLAIDPRQPDVMYVGTGEGYFREEIRGTGLPLRGNGIFVTRDGGTRWERLASTNTPDFYWVNDLELGIGDSRRIYAATRTGVWRSTDEGQNWSRLLETNVRGGCLDLAIRPDDNADVLFASCGSYEQATVYRFPRAGTDSVAEVVLREEAMGRTSLAIAPSNPDVMYAMAASNDPGPNDTYRQGLLAVYRSERGGIGGSWEARVRNTDATKLNTLILTNPGAATVQDCSPTARNDFINMGWYINVIAVDPADPNRVWAAGVDWFRSDDGGRNWGLANGGSARAAIHVDQHGIAFHPRYDGTSNQILIVGNDGGVYRTANARARVSTSGRAACDRVAVELVWESLNRDYGVTQFYHGLPFPDGRRYLAGAQDNGTMIGSDDAGVNGARPVFGGDGSYVAINPANPQIFYVQSQWSNIGRTMNGGQNFSGVRNGLDPVRSDVLGPEANYLFVTPIVMDQTTPERLWLGGEFLYRTQNAASQWVKASTAMPDGGLVSALAIAPSDGNRVAAGTNTGYVLWSAEAYAGNAQTEWSSSRPREGWITSVAFDPRTPTTIYATYGNFGGAHVYRSTDGGASWQSLDGEGDAGLPDIPVHSIVIDPSDPARLYLGTDLGVFASIDGGRRWLVEETGFGPAVTEWLALLNDGSGRRTLFAFTHGRGAWRVNLP